MLETIGSTFTAMIGWVGEFVSSLVTTEGDLNALLIPFAIGIVASLFMFGIKGLKSLVWGA